MEDYLRGDLKILDQMQRICIMQREDVWCQQFMFRLKMLTSEGIDKGANEEALAELSRLATDELLARI